MHVERTVGYNHAAPSELNARHGIADYIIPKGWNFCRNELALLFKLRRSDIVFFQRGKGLFEGWVQKRGH